MGEYDNKAMESQPEEKKGLLSKLFSKYKGKKKFELIIIFIILAVIIAIFASSFAKTQESTAQPEADSQAKADQQKDDLENKLEETLSQISGAGKVRVMITFDSGPELVTAMDTNTQTSNIEEQTGETKRTTANESEAKKPVTVQQQDGAHALVLTQKNPEIRGVIVVAEGAWDVRVRMDLLRAVQTVLDVDAECVEVFVMNTN